MNQNEMGIEMEFIKKLIELGYTFRDDIRNLSSLEANFREKFNRLNKDELRGKPLSDAEFDRLKSAIITADVYKASKTLRNTQTMTRDDNTALHYKLIDSTNWCHNEYEVVLQLRMNPANTYHRYDVIILVNGLPLTQVELKEYAVSPRVAMKQILDYKSDEGNGYRNSWMCFVQMFVVSNYTQTNYFANNNDEYFKFDAKEQYLPVYTLAREDNTKITNLIDFADCMLQKCKLGEMICRYMVLLECKRQILIMRPYQIYAVKAILKAVDENRGNGFIWHTTGSGKTLTSFKASTLMKENSNIEKCVFVVDRKDLDSQTRQEFNKFQEGCVEENIDTEALVQKLESTDYAYKVIVTTIQKLGIALDPQNGFLDRLRPLSRRRLVFIFDECHRSQFGENHKAIKKFFPRAQMFGFTGTPIFRDNATKTEVNGVEAQRMTTRDIFGPCLHKYTIMNAINDNNVLRFRMEYYEIDAQGKPSIHTDALPGVAQGPTDDQVKLGIARAILQKHDAVTANRKFNAIFATASINDAIKYYNVFKQEQQRRQEEDPDYQPLNICCVFSPATEGLRGDTKKMAEQIQEDLPQESLDNQINTAEKTDALIHIIKDYNTQYNTSFSLSVFDQYYRDIQKRIKDQEYASVDHSKKVDITIVVDMLLTGFDSKYLNTMYVDKNLKYHSLLQAYSRTNRILNGTKPWGNILDFRCQQQETDDAMLMFSGQDTEQPRHIWIVQPVEGVVEDLNSAVERLNNLMQPYKKDPEQPFKAEDVANLPGTRAKLEFVQGFKDVQSAVNQLGQYTEIPDEVQETIETIIPEHQVKGMQAQYVEIAHSMKNLPATDPDIAEVETTDFELVLFSTTMVDYDYIMRLITNLTRQKPQVREVQKAQVKEILRGSVELMNEQEYMCGYIDSLQTETELDEDTIRRNYIKYKNRRINEQISELAKGYQIDENMLRTAIDNTVSLRYFDITEWDTIFNSFPWDVRDDKIKELLSKLRVIFNQRADGAEINGFEGIINGMSNN